MNFINLTTGIEWLDEITPDSFVRIESTLCEQHNWGLLIQRLDANFLFHLARGEELFLYDTTSRYSDLSRVCWQGVPLINYLTSRLWYDTVTPVFFKLNPVDKYCENVYFSLPKSCRSKLKYFKRFCGEKIGRIIPVCRASNHDGDTKWFSNRVLEFGLDSKK